jgi:hypothetical protein
MSRRHNEERKRVFAIEILRFTRKEEPVRVNSIRWIFILPSSTEEELEESLQVLATTKGAGTSNNCDLGV